MPERKGNGNGNAKEGDVVRARAFWSGTITFGLVSIPVNLFPGTRSQGIALRMLAEDGTPLARRYFCPKHERAVDWDDIVRGYEIEKDEYVVVTEDELEALEPHKSRDIDLRRFVPQDDIDPVYFERPYYLVPAGESVKAYRLLADTIEQTKRAGIATFVMRGKEYLVAIFAEKGILRAETLRFADEIRAAADVGLPEPARVKRADVTRLKKAIESRTRTSLAEKELADEYAERVRKLVARKERKDEDVYELPEEVAEEEAAPDTSVIDLVEVLKRSLQTGAGGGTRKRARKSGTRTRKRKKAS